MRQRKNMTGVIIAVAVALMVVVAIIGSLAGLLGGSSDPGFDYTGGGTKTLEELVSSIKVETATPVKGQLDLSDASLYDELPEIDKYPILVRSNADIVLEIFSSPEKAGESANKESWLIDVAEDFNKMGVVTSSGKTCGIEVRNVTSGLAADYIISGKYVPDLFTPSSSVWGALVQSKGRVANLECEKLVGNTAGVMVKKNLSYDSVDAIIEAVVAGQLNLGYTNPQVSSAGMNMLLTVLEKYGNGDMTSDAAVDGFTKFQENVPYVAYNTNQMITSAGVGSLDCFVAEYQGYVNNKEFVKEYDFIPYGVRHDNPLYSCRDLRGDERECLDEFIKYATGSEAQKNATDFGFNGNSSYKNAFDTPSGSVIEQSQKIWKSNKDVGKSIVAVFVADCSGSMAGTPMAQLKESLTNGMKYVNENNYVGLVSYSSGVVKELEIDQFTLNQQAYFQGAVDGLSANGNTHTYEAICVALDMINDAKELHPDAKCMVFLLSDGAANGRYDLGDVTYAIQQEEVPIYTIGYGDGASLNELAKLSEINEAAAIVAEPSDVIYQIRNLFNAQL